MSVLMLKLVLMSILNRARGAVTKNVYLGGLWDCLDWDERRRSENSESCPVLIRDRMGCMGHLISLVSCAVEQALGSYGTICELHHESIGEGGAPRLAT